MEKNKKCHVVNMIKKKKLKIQVMISNFSLEFQL